MCDFQKLVPHIICNSITRDTSGIFTLNECLKDTKVHLKSLNLEKKWMVVKKSCHILNDPYYT